MVFATLQTLIGTDTLTGRFPASVFVATSPDPAFALAYFPLLRNAAQPQAQGLSRSFSQAGAVQGDVGIDRSSL